MTPTSVLPRSFAYDRGVSHSYSAQTDAWTTRRLLGWSTEFFEKHTIDSPRLTAELLLSHIIGCERLKLYMEVERPATPEELAELRDGVRRVANHEPLQYVTGQGWFYGRPFEVNSSTLVPRPSTETLIETIIQHVQPKRVEVDDVADHFPSPSETLPPARSQHKPTEQPSTDDQHWEPLPGLAPDDAAENDISKINDAATQDGSRHSVQLPSLRILELGTGTGCVAITLALELCRWFDVNIVATDLNDDILNLASRNAAAHSIESHIEFRNSSLFDALDDSAESFDIICSNPPYIADNEWQDVEPNVRDHEPATALRGGPDGLDIIRPLVHDAHQFLKSGGLLAIEFGHHQHEDIKALLTSHQELVDIKTRRDLEQFWRVVTAIRAGND